MGTKRWHRNKIQNKNWHISVFKLDTPVLMEVNVLEQSCFSASTECVLLYIKSM